MMQCHIQNMLRPLSPSPALRCNQNPPLYGGMGKCETGAARRRPTMVWCGSISSAAASPTVRVLFAAGGTGGHVYPAIAIADEMKCIDSNVEILFVGTRSRMEWKAVPNAGYQIFPIPGVAIRRPFFSPVNILLPIRLLQCMWVCWGLLGELNPHIVVGTGGYVAGPICLAAAVRGIRMAIQEQNVSPGIANKILGLFASMIFVAFSDSLDFFPKNKCVISGNPIRPALRKYVSNAVARSHFFPRGSQSGLPKEMTSQVVLVLGGSLGANSMNIAVLGMYFDMLSKHQNRCIIWQTGTNNFDEMDSLVRDHPRLKMFPFLNSMDLAYAAADLVVARAGAMTCSELLATGKPSILCFLEVVHLICHKRFCSTPNGDVVWSGQNLMPRYMVPGLSPDIERLECCMVFLHQSQTVLKVSRLSRPLTGSQPLNELEVIQCTEGMGQPSGKLKWKEKRQTYK